MARSSPSIPKIPSDSARRSSYLLPVVVGLVGTTLSVLAFAIDYGRHQQLLRDVCLRAQAELWEPWTVLAAGLALTVLLLCHLIAELRHRRRLRAEVERSERAQQTADLLKQQMEYILGATKTGLDIIDSQFVVRYVDPEWAKVYGDYTGRRCYEYFMGREDVCPGCGIIEALRTKARTVTEEFLVRENNRPVQVTTIPFQNGDGEWLVAEVNADISDRKETEQELRKAKERYQAIVDNIGIGVALISRDMRILELNRAMRLWFPDVRIEDRPVCYRTFNTPPREDVCSYCPTLKTLKDGEVHEGATDTPTPVGIRNYRIVASPIRDASGSVVAAIEMVEDITESRKAERERERHAAELSRLNEELERSNRDLQEFTYAVSHDLQEPLRKVHAFGEFLLEDCGDRVSHQGKEHLRRMHEATDRMKRLIHHLLELSRVGTQGGKLSPTDPKGAAEEAVDTLSDKVREAGAEVEVEPRMPAVMADRTQLVRVFQNLVGNALKFRAADRPPRVQIGAHGENGSVVFSVSDNGIGVERRFLEKIFGLFQRLHTRDEYEGSGVGLALCNKIVQRHGGRIWAESQPGKGSTFFFTLRGALNGKEDGRDGSGQEDAGPGATGRG